MELKDYLDEINSVPGWCVPELWNCIEPIDIFQKNNNINGPIAEIGVYHGKFFIGLAIMKNHMEKHCAIDVFEMQEFNLDYAGKGDLREFNKNLTRYKIDNYETITADSLRLSEDIIAERRNKFSLFSIDACHRVEHTINDLKIAMKMVKKEGIIFIDDYYNPNWPGVQEGITKFYWNQTPDFVPLLYTCNKLFLCSLSFHKLYLKFVSKFLVEHYSTSKIKKVPRFGYETLTVTPNRSLKKYVV